MVMCFSFIWHGIEVILEGWLFLLHAARANFPSTLKGCFLFLPFVVFPWIFCVVIVIKGKTLLLMEMLSLGCACFTMMMWA